ncbi:MAG: hypothetical protein HC939_10875 [Pleurocapsa sp. SU_5_0]|nr:hypothetical protein [Pleurocapsa sp. SU_5_0]NJO97362.1 hypothetical protein [Pleurocapsa sp. CRU_1_2]NJR47279.1 hypothetical protein [Hyellaceae cyanobacterium CSU_1_1]
MLSPITIYLTYQVLANKYGSKLKLQIGILLYECLLKIVPYLSDKGVVDTFSIDLPQAIVEWQERLEVLG